MSAEIEEPLYPPDPPLELVICVAGVERTLRGTDTTVYRWSLHPELDHAYHQYRTDEGEEKQLAIFGGNTKLLDTLEEMGFYTQKNGHITDWDIKAYLTWERQLLESELDEL